jgi:DNA invertase Pin-like site-specific DNA recombinase
LYGRESFDPKGTAEQVKAQLADMRPFALAIGGRIGKEFPENDVSAFRRKRITLPDGTDGYRVIRPDWDAMMTAFRRGEYNALCLPNIDRGMRDPRDLEDLIDLVEHYGVYVVGMTGNLDLTTDEGISSARTEVNQRNQESRNISRRTTKGKRRAAMEGKIGGGPIRPFGWRKYKITINKREAKHIQREVPRLIAGVRPITIAREWNERGIPTVTGAEWRAMTIVQIFTNPRLCGWRTYHDEVLKDADDNPIKGVWEPIVTESEHHALVANIRPTRKPRGHQARGRGHTTKYLLSPFVRCGKCNAKIHGAPVKDKRTGNTYTVYRCPVRGWGGCGGVARRAAPIDEYITELVLAEQSKIRLEPVTPLAPWDKAERLARVTRKIREATTAYKADRMSDARYYALVEDLEAEEAELKAEKRRYDAKRQAREAEIPNLRDEWKKPSFTLEQKQAAIAKSIRAVIVMPTSVSGRKFDPNRTIKVVWRENEEDNEEG